MRCLCCGKEITDHATSEEKQWQWHKRCVRSFFKTSELPLLQLTDQQLTNLANKTVNEGYTVTGVQKKLSLHLSAETKARLTLVDYPSGYILKPQTDEYSHLPEYEDLAMRLTKIIGVQTVPHALIKIGTDYAYITKRIDRDISSSVCYLYAMEDFCQLTNHLTQDKYRGSYESCGKIINKYSSTPGLDMSELYIRVLASFIIGNSDMHLKNLSLIETQPGNRIYHLSPAYDILPVNVIMPQDTDQLALTINSKNKNIHIKEFKLLAKSYGIPDNAAVNMIRKTLSLKPRLLQEVDLSYLTPQEKENVKSLIEERINTLSV